MKEDDTILCFPHQGVNVLGLFWAFLGLFPTSLAVATLELSQQVAGSLLIFGLAASILLDVWWRFSSEPKDGGRRFFRLSAGGCVLWMPYWLAWFVLIPLVVAISLGRR